MKSLELSSWSASTTVPSGGRIASSISRKMRSSGTELGKSIQNQLFMYVFAIVAREITGSPSPL